MIDREFLRKTGAVIAGLFLFFIFAAVSDANITGYFLVSGNLPLQVDFGFIVLVIAIVMLFFVLVNKGNMKEIAKNMVGAIAIYVGLYTITKIITDLDILVGLISLTFGIMAIIWVIKARTALSEGSSLKAYATSFLFCVVFILLFSMYDSYISIFDVKGNITYLKHFLITLVYIIIVYTSYRIHLLGSEFGFSEQKLKIKKAMRK